MYIPNVRAPPAYRHTHEFDSGLGVRGFFSLGKMTLATLLVSTKFWEKEFGGEKTSNLPIIPHFRSQRVSLIIVHTLNTNFPYGERLARQFSLTARARSVCRNSIRY